MEPGWNFQRADKNINAVPKSVAWRNITHPHKLTERERDTYIHTQKTIKRPKKTKKEIKVRQSGETFFAVHTCWVWNMIWQTRRNQRTMQDEAGARFYCGCFVLRHTTVVALDGKWRAWSVENKAKGSCSCGRPFGHFIVFLRLRNCKLELYMHCIKVDLRTKPFLLFCKE